MAVSLQSLATRWQFAWAPSLLAVAAAVLYLVAVSRVRGRGRMGLDHGRPWGRPTWPLWRTLSFVAGLATVVVALESGLGAYDDELLSVHMLQHVLLLDVAPPLLLAGAPLLLWLRALPRRERAGLARLLRGSRRCSGPATCMALYWLVLGVWHLPGCFDAALRSAPLHELEHASFLIAGLALWWPLHGFEPVRSRQLDALGRLVYALVAMLPMDAVGAYLNRATEVVYAPYAGAGHVLGVNAVVNQQVGGAVMWVAGSMVMVVGGLSSCLLALLAEERRQRALEARV